ncbi:uncharacterized protein [Symphalangus syndactylus]|uniref:uncharacterized protein n=1 Tax=Symphalangus syndactylus TaxID=9590 RepID=UPI0030074F90
MRQISKQPNCLKIQLALEQHESELHKSTILGFPSASATPETARPTPPLLLPPQPTQLEDHEDEDLDDDPLPLNEYFVSSDRPACCLLPSHVELMKTRCSTPLCLSTCGSFCLECQPFLPAVHLSNFHSSFTNQRKHQRFGGVRKYPMWNLKNLQEGQRVDLDATQPEIEKLGPPSQGQGHTSAITTHKQRSMYELGQDTRNHLMIAPEEEAAGAQPSLFPAILKL